jgi:hypothetical protein
MRIFLTLSLLGIVAYVVGGAVASWWAQPAEAFFGRRSAWWDAEDFAVFYGAGKLVAAGQPHMLYTLSAYTETQRAALDTHQNVTLGYYNPPFFSLIFAPLSWLSFDRAFQVWTAINLALLALNCWLLWHVAAPLGRGWRLVLIAGFVTLYPVTFILRLGQFSFILMASWSAAYLLLRRGRDRAAGFALLPLLIKPEMLIPITIFLVWKRRVDVLKTLLPASALIIVGSIAMIGPMTAWDYPFYLHDSALDGTGNMYGWNGLLSSVRDPGNPGTQTALALPLSLLTLGAVALAWRGPLDTIGERFPMQWLLLLCATMLTDMHFYLQDVVILVPAAFAVHASLRGWQRDVSGVALTFGWLILGLGSTPNVNWHLNFFATYVVAWGCVLITVRVLSERRATAASDAGWTPADDIALARAA